MYDFKTIEEKWIKKWEEDGIYKTPTDVNPENKYYILPQLPYPSGSGLHVGHAEVYSACDIIARFKRMKGGKVLQVIGWDAFGLPAENYAIKTNIHPRINTDKAVDNFREQITKMGVSVDWDREVGSHNPDYYKWTQWFFLLMYNQGLAYRKNQKVNWCDSCKTVLANEQVLDDARTDKDGKEYTVEVCERCDTVVEHRMMEQWYLKITEYADRLAKDLDKVDWPAETVKRQRDWIGRSEGASIKFQVSSSGSQVSIEVFTTRPDTLFGATYMVLAPEHELVSKITTDEQREGVEKYVESASKKTEIERTDMTKEKTGAFTGAYAINPINGKEIPIWIADYVLTDYGTGAIMAVPAHDQRDMDFAKKYGLEVIEVVRPVIGKPHGGEKSRETITAIVRRKSDGKFLYLNWQRQGWVSPVIGGIDQGEDLEKAAEREVFEETGYRVKFVKDLKISSETYFYADHKNEWRQRFDHAVYLELDDEEAADVGVDEKELHEVIWLSADEAKERNTFDYNNWGLLEILGERSVYAGKGGKLINSGDFDGLTVEEGQKEIVGWLSERGLGEAKVTYKLRDWSVSRQRFWGAPIPFLHRKGEWKMLRQAQHTMENGELKYMAKPDFVLTAHAYESVPEKEYHPWIDAELKKMGIKSSTPELPGETYAKFDEWVEVLEKELDENVGDDTSNTVVNGRSLGSWAILKLAETREFRKLVLVCPANPTQWEGKGAEMLNAVFKDYKDGICLDVLKKFMIEDGKINFEKVAENVEEVVVYLGVDDPYVHHLSTAEFFKEKLPFVRIKRFREGGHFRSKDGFEEFPSLLEEITREVRPDLKPVPESDLPVILPDDVDFKPTGQSPLNYSKSFNDGVKEKYGEEFSREPDTLDTFMCSSWYYYRYLDPKNDEAFASPEALKTWMPVDFYLGGPEHVNGHLLYSRFFTKVLYDAGYIDFDEPFTVHRHQGLILGEDNRKMSKRWGNVINPTDVVNEYGADTLRMYEMFMGPLEDTKPWSSNGVLGVKRFLDKVWSLHEKVSSINSKDQSVESSSEVIVESNKLIKKVEQDIERLSFNTAIAKMMEYVNLLQKVERIDIETWKKFLLVLAPFAPFISEELWSVLDTSVQTTRTDNLTSIHLEKWPEYDEELTHDEMVTIAVQVNGKVRDSVKLTAGSQQQTVEAKAKESLKVQKHLEGREIKKVIYVPDRIINFVVK